MIGDGELQAENISQCEGGANGHIFYHTCTLTSLFHPWFSSHYYPSRRKAPDLSWVGQDHYDVALMPRPLPPPFPPQCTGTRSGATRSPPVAGPPPGAVRASGPIAGMIKGKSGWFRWEPGEFGGLAVYCWWWVCFFTEPSSQRLLQKSQKKIAGPPATFLSHKTLGL